MPKKYYVQFKRRDWANPDCPLPNGWWPRHKNLCGWAKDVREVFGAKHIIELRKNEVWNRTFAPLFSEEIQHLKKIGINENDNPLTVRPPIAEEN